MATSAADSRPPTARPEPAADAGSEASSLLAHCRACASLFLLCLQARRKGRNDYPGKGSKGRNNDRGGGGGEWGSSGRSGKALRPW